MTANNERKPRRPSLASIVKQAAKSGVRIARIEVEPTGKITIVTGDAGNGDSAGDNPWDEVLGRRNGP
jgi:hypothetical protein